MTEIKRATRVAEGVRQEISMLISQSLRDPRVRGAVVSRVEMTDDLREARVYVRALEGAEDKEKKKELVEGLTRAAGMLRREIAKALKLRVAPELKFFFDEGDDKRTRVESLLMEIEHDARTQKKSKVE
ncbi:MAG: 30S ribosome-binding factor RbfA [Polyangiaceae bacterium]